MIGVVLNPRGGRGSARSRWEVAEWLLTQAGAEFTMVETTGPGSAQAQARALAEDGCQMVVAAGGDGTVSHVMQGILGTSSILGVLPCGTGNDVARMLGIGTNIPLAVEALIGGKLVDSDVFRWETEKERGHSINVAGCGFDAMVAERVNAGFKFMTGTLAYHCAIGATLKNYRPINVEITNEFGSGEFEIMLCAVANTKSYGGGLRIAPDASIEDGLADVVVVGNLKKAEFVLNFPRLIAGTHLGHPKIKHTQCRTVRIEAESEMAILSDGEVLRAKSISFEVIHRALRVCVGNRYLQAQGLAAPVATD